MSKIKEMISDWRYVRLCLYIVFTAALLYIIYLVIGNIDQVLETVSSVIRSLTSAFSPLIIGLILAYLISPLVEFIDNKIISKFFFRMPTDPVKLEKREGLKRTISILITYLLIIVIICGIIYAFAVLIVGQLVFTSVQSMIDSIVAYFMKYESVIRGWALNLPTTGLEDRLQNVANTVISWISDNFSTSSVLAFIANIGGSLLNMVLGIVVSIYLIKDKDFFIRLWRKTLHLLLPMKAHAKVSETLSDINTVVSQFLRGQLLDALIIAVLSSIGLTVIGLDFAVFLGCFAGLANVIPYFGPILSAVPAAIIGLLTGGVSQALLALLVLIFIQQIDSNIIYPRVVGSSTGLHPLFILVSVTVGGYYWGIIGMILAVPIAAILKLFIMKKIDGIE
ncbi:AI-2E family transporter [Sinanaerobacter chloroacetimidivorans]|jgi:predicted PurR-regulated permease PerM|uniref:AI-2E family transporter n=1 Tax=Sinanaerobacter chloroacetimidivorans TaxID=2818044 RepID=A0A8J8B2E0_9FIRM|nr:AI-2E family transporter [Sinanaerobacter chloroacetimidivorans]MBR0599708.1 AI-2E family transporter [Sinanaerobacter chloroacetimidivorans]